MHVQKSILIAVLAFLFMPLNGAFAQVPSTAHKTMQQEEDDLSYDEAASHAEMQALKEASPAGSISDYVEEEDPYTVSNVYIDLKDVPVSKARDQALMQAQRLAYRSLCQRFGVQDNSDSLDDDAIAAMVKSFEMQKEQISSARYIGVFKILFKEDAAKKRMYADKKDNNENMNNTFNAPMPSMPQNPFNPSYGASMSTIRAEVAAPSSESWGRIKAKIASIPLVTDIKIERLGTGVVKTNISFNGSIHDLAQMLSQQNLLLRQISYDTYEIYEM